MSSFELEDFLRSEEAAGISGPSEDERREIAHRLRAALDEVSAGIAAGEGL